MDWVPKAYQVPPTLMMDGSGKSVDMTGPLTDRLACFTGAASPDGSRDSSPIEANNTENIIVLGFDSAERDSNNDAIEESKCDTV